MTGRARLEGGAERAPWQGRCRLKAELQTALDGLKVCL